MALNTSDHHMWVAEPAGALKQRCPPPLQEWSRGTVGLCPQPSPFHPLHGDTGLTLLEPTCEQTAHLSWVDSAYLNHLRATPVSFLAHWSLELKDIE